MTALRGTRSVAGLATAGALVVQLALLRLGLTADDEHAYIFGHRIGFGCAMRERTGLPCPMCGVTRAVAFTVHGELEHAFRLFPLAPAVCLGVVGLAAGLVVLFALGELRDGRFAQAFTRHLRHGALAYAAFCSVMWLADYASRVGSSFLRG